MKKQMITYRFFRYEGKMLLAKKEIPFEITLNARLVLDQLCYNWNKKQLQMKINDAIDAKDEATFKQLSDEYRMMFRE